jgi:hypothetical protein
MAVAPFDGFAGFERVQAILGAGLQQYKATSIESTIKGIQQGTLADGGPALFQNERFGRFPKGTIVKIFWKEIALHLAGSPKML